MSEVADELRFLVNGACRLIGVRLFKIQNGDSRPGNDCIIRCRWNLDRVAEGIWQILIQNLHQVYVSLMMLKMKQKDLNGRRYIALKHRNRLLFCTTSALIFYLYDATSKQPNK